jgi:Flp pilus assembly protein TadD
MKKERESKMQELQSQYDARLHDLRQLEQAAQILISNGDLDNAIDTLTRLMSTRKVVLKLMKAIDLDSTNEKVETAYTLKLFGKVLLKKGDKLNAERAFRDSLKLFRKGDEKDQAAVDEVKHLLDKLQNEAVTL